MSTNKMRVYAYKKQMRAEKILNILTGDISAELILENDIVVKVTSHWFQYWKPTVGDFYAVFPGNDAKVISINEFLSNWEPVSVETEEEHF